VAAGTASFKADFFSSLLGQRTSLPCGAVLLLQINTMEAPHSSMAQPSEVHFTPFGLSILLTIFC
ncbi:hypothetical protein, partial [Paracoccus jeotgali]|uniref:hypothetical protein n=1 Tax=Paracoccus jeotgali TaxID=2065379 RepID=UPI0028A611BA